MILLSHTHTKKKRERDDRDDVRPIIMQTINKNEKGIDKDKIGVKCKTSLIIISFKNETDQDLSASFSEL